MKKINFLIAAITISLIGCKSSDNPSPAAPKPTFSLSNDSHSALTNVGCDTKDGSVQCDAIDDLHGIQGMSYTMDNLKNKKNGIDKQVSALDTVIDELDEASKKTWSIDSSIELTKLKTSAITTRAFLVAQQQKYVTMISQEELFGNVLGYSCSGSYDLSGQNTEFKDSMLFSSQEADAPVGIEKETVTTGDKSQTYFRKNVSDTDASLWMRENQKDIRLRIGSDGEPVQTIGEVDVFSVWMDGEFTLESHAIPYEIKKASCLKMRLSNATPTSISQRIIERGPRLTCHTASSKPKTVNGELEYFGIPNVTLSFNRDEDEARVFSKYSSEIGVTFNQYIDEGFKYFFDVSNSHGALEFELIDLENGEVLASVKTVNSSKNISLNYLNQGYGARIECFPPKEE